MTKLFKSPLYIRLQAYRLSISNALNYQPLKKPLATFSFDRAKLMKGQKLLDKVLEWESSKDDRYGAQKDATDTVAAEREAIRKQFGEHRQLAQLAFKEERGVQTLLKLDTRIKKDFSGWLTQATVFYDRIGPHQAGIARYGVTSEDLQTTQSRLLALVSLYDQHSQRKAEAQNTTEQRNKAIKELDAWMREFYQIAKIALKDEPQLLEALGVTVAAQV